MKNKKILLIRDYSGMLSQLAHALRLDGVSVTLASIADAFKGNYGCDIDLERPVLGVKLVDQYLNYLKLIFNKNRYDVIHLQTQLLGGSYSVLLIPIIFLLKRKSNFLTVSLAGDDYKYWTYGPNRMKYGPFDDAVAIDLNGGRPYYKSIFSRLVCWYVEKEVDYLIPACYDYAICHKENPKLMNHVPFLWDVNGTPNKVFYFDGVRKIKIFHGLGRKGFKGSEKIVQALRLIEAQFPGRVQILVPEKIPYSEYKKCLEDCDIFVDQCNSYSYGMAAVEALALGKVVLSGAEIEALDYMNAMDCPVVNITPDVDDIFSKLKYLIENPNKLALTSVQSREFAEKFHSSKSVLYKWYDIWSRNC